MQREDTIGVSHEYPQQPRRGKAFVVSFVKVRVIRGRSRAVDCWCDGSIPTSAENCRGTSQRPVWPFVLKIARMQAQDGKPFSRAPRADRSRVRWSLDVAISKDAAANHWERLLPAAGPTSGDGRPRCVASWMIPLGSCETTRLVARCLSCDGYSLSYHLWSARQLKAAAPSGGFAKRRIVRGSWLPEIS
jgi:hypothetical protein